MAAGPSPKTPFTEILAWAAKQPLWQQEAIRRILASNASLSAKSIGELVEQCLAEQGGAQPSIKPLTQVDLPLADGAAQAVALLGFGLAKNVNALRSDQWLKIGPQLTVIFGNNASGKSGYGRILKKAFRARIVEDLQPDVRAEKLATNSPEATFEFRKGTNESSRHVWTAVAPLSAEVASRFAVLDAKCGQAYVVNNELQVAPQGLDVLPRLVEVLEAVREQLRLRRAACSTAKPFLDGVNLTSPTASFVSAIGATTEFEEVLDRISFDDAQKMRLEEARVELAQLKAQSPQQLASQLTAAKKAATSLKAGLEKWHLLLGEGGVAKVVEARSRLAAAADAAKKVKTLSSDQKIVASVGTEPWVALIEAAGQFVESSAEGAVGLAVDDKCALCLEPLSKAGSERLARFWAFVTNTAAEQKAEAEGALAAILEELETISSPDGHLATLASLISPYDDKLPESLDEAIAVASAAAAGLVVGNPTKAVDLAKLIARVEKVSAKIATKSAASSTETNFSKTMSALVAEIAELEARQLLFARQASIQSYLAGLRNINLLDAASAGIKSLAATKKSGELNEEFITDSYRVGVEAELKRLGFARPIPVLVQQGMKGKVKILTLANPKYKTVTADQVFSEGERTAIAIASFFSELSLTASQTGLIFDDPISSLDHRIRERVAERLVAEAEKRQVVVFTHDLVFMSELARLAKEKSVGIETCELSSTSSVVGIVSPNPPWDSMKVSARATALEEILKEAKQLDQNGNAAELAVKLHRFLALLRSTWERFIEEKMLAGALERFNRHIKPNSLYEVCFDAGLVDDVVNQINGISGLIEAHDHSAAMNTPPLTLTEASERLAQLRGAVAKHKGLKKAPAA